jgi:hypothetical protein
MFSYNRHDCWYCDWLKTPREDGKPRALFLSGDNMDGPLFSHSHFIKHIKKVYKTILESIRKREERKMNKVH